MRTKKLLRLSLCVCGVVCLCANNVKTEYMNEEEYKKDLIKVVRNETNLSEDVEELVIPCFGKITSDFGYREIANELASRNHKGIDIGAPKGTSIFAAHSGTVTKSAAFGNYGNCIIIENEKYKTIYAHCSKLFVEEGEKVVQGEKIAEVGATGNATGNHLHFEIIKEGKNLNPGEVMEW